MQQKMPRDSASDDALLRAIAARDAFFEAAAHDLRSPLTALMLQLDTVLAQLQQLNDPPPAAALPTIEQRVRAARRQVDHLVRLTDRLTDVVRIEAGGGAFRLEREPLDLLALASSSAERCEAQLRWAGCALSLSGEPVHVTADRTRIDEVLGNLLGNASKYAAGAAVDVAVKSDGARALVCVADRGPGIPRHMKERIFDKFERGTHGVVGLGLGLWISRAIVEAHGGSLLVDDTPGGGATFVMSLPKEQPREQAVAS